MDIKDAPATREIHLKNAAGELLCIVTCENMDIEAYMEYQPFVLCTKGDCKGKMIPIGESRSWTNEADAQAAVEDYVKALRRSARFRGFDISTIHIESRIVFTAQSKWAPVSKK